MFYIDPVCKKKLRKKEEYVIITYGGAVYHLCRKACKGEFQKSPVKYIPEGNLVKEKTSYESSA